MYRVQTTMRDNYYADEPQPRKTNLVSLHLPLPSHLTSSHLGDLVILYFNKLREIFPTKQLLIDFPVPQIRPCLAV